jgi:thiamine pyrophosphate-dependent acetolactate synthase large subunit-like protein
MLTIGELAGLAQCQAPLIVLVLNDHWYSVLRNIEASILGRPQARDVDLATLDFVMLT